MSAVPMHELVKEAQGRRRWRACGPRYKVARTALEAFAACEDVRSWLEELARNPILEHEAVHCVGEALSDLRAVRVYVRMLSRKPEPA